MKKYPFISCLEPQRVVNPYTKKEIIVPCGKCVACINRKSANMTLKCKLESKVSKYTYFVTLTYANEYVPKAIVVDSPYNGKMLVDVTERHDPHKQRHMYGDNYGFVLNETCNTDAEIRLLQRKVDNDGFLNILYKRDLQNFIKRLRKQISNDTKEKIRYYAVGEYGLSHFRPHYHLLLYFNDRQIASNLRKYLYSCWRYGRIDFGKSRGKCANYTSSYVNSFGNLPSIYQKVSIAPFQLHSTYFGEKFLRDQQQNVYEMSAREFNKRIVQLDTSVTEFVAWRSFKNYYFPKCKGYDSLTYVQRLHLYRLYVKVYQRTRLHRVSDQVKDILEYFFNPNPSLTHYDDKLYETFYKITDIPCVLAGFSEFTIERVANQLYSILHLSYHFITRVCGIQSPMDDSFEISQKMVKRIEQYYKDSDYDNLTDNLQTMCDYGLDNDYSCEEDYHLFYNNMMNFKKLYDNKDYQNYYTLQHKIHVDKVKHKKQNDNNRIFMF